MYQTFARFLHIKYYQFQVYLNLSSKIIYDPKNIRFFPYLEKKIIFRVNLFSLFSQFYRFPGSLVLNSSVNYKSMTGHSFAGHSSHTLMTPSYAQQHSSKVLVISVQQKKNFFSNKRQNIFQNIIGVFLWQGEVGDGDRGVVFAQIKGKVTCPGHTELKVSESWLS